MFIEDPSVFAQFVLDTSVALEGLSKNVGLDYLSNIFGANQAFIKYGLWTLFEYAYNRAVKDNKIKPEYLKTTKAQLTLRQLLIFLRSDQADEDRWEILQQIFFLCASEESKDYIQQLEYMETVQSISKGALLLLIASYNSYLLHEVPIEPVTPNRDLYSPHIWADYMAKQTGLLHLELVYKYENELINNHLMNDRTSSDRSGIRLQNTFRLTGYGIALCEYALTYEDIK